MVKVVLDTNILIDFLGGVQQARDEIARHSEPAISVMSWMEVLVGVDPASSEPTRLFLDSFSSNSSMKWSRHARSPFAGFTG